MHVVLSFTGMFVKQQVSNLKEASDQMRSTIIENEFGASDMRRCCGDVVDNGKRVAVVSYNGRVWTHNFDHPDCSEITSNDLLK